MSKFSKWLVVILVLLVGTVTFSIFIAQQKSTPKQISYIALPHPDDEFQAWSLLEHTPENYKVFILMTHGEQTRYCDQDALGISHGGKWSDQCERDRVGSFVKFFHQMSLSDSTIPGDFEYLGFKGPFPANGVQLQRTDEGAPYAASTQPEVYIDRHNRGALVIFNLGDGDLTPQEVSWAIRTVKNNRENLGIDSTLPNYNLLGSYANKSYEGCFVYSHPDHLAVHDALYNTNFELNYQAGATCASDPDAMISKSVTPESASAAFGAGGAFPNNYAWIGNYRLSSDQSLLFMTQQSFWQRFVQK